MITHTHISTIYLFSLYLKGRGEIPHAFQVPAQQHWSTSSITRRETGWAPRVTCPGLLAPLICDSDLTMEFHYFSKSSKEKCELITHRSLICVILNTNGEGCLHICLYFFLEFLYYINCLFMSFGNFPMEVFCHVTFMFSRIHCSRPCSCAILDITNTFPQVILQW